jgi:WD40 repeat protein
VTVHDFGQALLAEIYNSPLTGGAENDTPIVFVAHSMGGIVVKKALILAKQDPSYHKIAIRIHSIFFLATPHRGADSASLLRNFQQMSGVIGSKAYVDNIIPNSEAISTINDQFRHIHANVQLWSFFETIKTPSLGLIVEKDSAILNLPGERIQLLNADHRHVCKFNDPSDSNYCTLRNAFASAISMIENTWFSMRKEEHMSHMKRLSEFLGYTERPDADLAILCDLHVQGSCEWLTDKPSFHSWREGVDVVPSVFWLRGHPATGKSTAVSHVIRYLEGSNAECSFFFFKHSIKGKFTVTELLCSLAWQMAASNTDIRRKLLSMQEEGITLDLGDPAALWRTIFLSRIFRTGFRQPHFWIIDALDESADVTILCHLLSRVDKDVRLRVFISSRPDLTIERLFSQEKFAITVESTSVETSSEDIRLYLGIHAEHLPVESDDDRNSLVAQIVEMSNGNFLWASLVVKELEDSFSQERIAEVLRSVPKGIDDLYSKIIHTIKTRHGNADVALSILRWVCCAARPLTVDELREALALDIKQTVPNLEKTASAICGYLISVDSKGRVYPKHQTVKDYLFRTKTAGDSAFAFDRAIEHGRVAEICLDFLRSDVMKTVRYRRSNMTARVTKRPHFTGYAVSYFSGHLARSTSSDDRHLIALNEFLLTNSLTWIELIAAQHELAPLTETAKNMKAFMTRRAKYRSPLGKEVQNVLEWADDLIRLVAQFGRALLSTPSSIHFLIPSVCPSASIISRVFVKYPRPLKLVGPSQSNWDDRLCCVTCAQLRAVCIACDVNKFAIGLSNGHVQIYHEKTFQKIYTLEHGDQIRCLSFSHFEGLLAVGSRKKASLWNMNNGGAHVWTASLNDLPLAFEFTEDDSTLMASTRDNKMIFWEALTGQEMRPITTFSDYDEVKGAPFGHNQPPIHAAFSPGLGLLGVAYRMRPISFWETESCTFAGQYHKAGASYHEPFVHAFIFNPVPDICLAAVSFQDGDLCVFDPWSQNTQATIHCDSSCLAASSNGTILASGDGEGIIKLFEFDTLRLLYQLNSHEENIRSISFGTNGLRFYDVRGNHCNVWEPSVLVRHIQSGDGSSAHQSEKVADEPRFTTARASDVDQEITAMVAHHEGDVLFCGTESGAIKVYSTTSGLRIHDIFEDPDRIAILLLQWYEHRDFLVSVDRTGRVLVHQLNKGGNGNKAFSVERKVFECTSPLAVQQVLLNSQGKRLLLVNSGSSVLWDLEMAKVISELPNPENHTLRWETHSHFADLLLLIHNEGMSAQTYGWNSLDLHAKPKSLNLNHTSEQKLEVRWIAASTSGRHICAIYGENSSKGVSSMLCVYKFESLLDDETQVEPIAIYVELARTIKQVIGCFQALVLFLNHDDWVCSLNIDAMSQSTTYTKHFYVPQQWQGSGTTIQMLVTKKGSVVLVSTDELAVFQKGLDFEEQLETPGAAERHGLGSSTELERPALRKGVSSPL